MKLYQSVSRSQRPIHQIVGIIQITIHICLGSGLRQMHAASFGYGFGMVQQIVFINYTTIEPLRQNQGLGLRKLKRDNLKNNYCISLI